MSGNYACFSAALRIRNAAHLHEQLSRNLGMAPSSVTVRGQPAGALGKPAPQDMWVLDAPIPEEAPLQQHLAWLADAIAGREPYLKQLLADGIEIDVFCGYRTNADYSHYTVPAGSFQFASDLGIPLHMSYIVA